MASNLLILGNGFDIAMNSKTSYEDFVHFVENMQNFSDYFPSEESPNQPSPTSLLKEIWEENELDNQIDLDINALMEIFPKKTFNPTFWKEQFEYNSYIEYVKKSKSSLGKNWSDLEHRIEDIAEAIEYIILHLDDYDILSTLFYSLQTGQIGRFETLLYDLENLFKNKPNSAAFDFIFETIIERKEIKQHYGLSPYFFMQEVNNYFISELEELTRLLHVYLIYLEKVEKNLTQTKTILDEFNNIEDSYILTFNYTNTAKHILGINDDNIHHIHGNIYRFNLLQNNLIFGIEDKSNSVNATTIAYQKYYQRIVKATGSHYKQFFENFSDNLNVIIFGHSIDPLDKEIFLDIFDLTANYGKMKYQHQGDYRIVIAYYNDDAKHSIVKNLSFILGKERLVELTGEGKLHFIKSDDTYAISKLLTDS